MARRGRTQSLTLLLMAGVLSAPVLVFVAMFGQRFWGWSRDLALDTLTLAVAPWLLAVGVICALILLWRAARFGAMGWLTALAAVAVVGGGIWLFLTSPYGPMAGPEGPHDVSTDIVELPAYSARLQRLHGDEVAASCSGVASIPTQLQAEDVGEALQKVGFRPAPSSLFRVEGTHTGLWFLMQHDATVRIRPGQTDVRVTARSDRPQGDEACRLLARIVRELQPRS